MPVEPTQRINGIPVIRKEKTDPEKRGKSKEQKKDDGEKKGKVDIKV
jgi:hypothetical protein